MKSKFAIIIIALFTSVSIFAQKPERDVFKEDNNLIDYEDDGAPPINGYRSQIEFHIAIPQVWSNEAMNRTFSGIINFQGGYNVKVVKDFRAGIYTNFSMFRYYAGKINTTEPMYYNWNVGANFSYEVSISERLFYMPSVMLGYSLSRFDNLAIPPKGSDDRPATYLDFHSFHAKTNHGIYYWVKQKRSIAIGLVFGVSFDTNNYSYSKTYITDQGTINQYSQEGITILGNIGFGVLSNFGIIKKGK